jgi:hypothetical protein
MNSANECGDNNGNASKLLEKRTLNPNNGTYLRSEATMFPISSVSSG